MVGKRGAMSQALSKARREYNNGYYSDKLRQGLEYQDFVAKELWKRGISIGCYSSQKYQVEEGESMAGIEIKRDGHFRKTGNLYIEVAEKAHPDNPIYVPSGIERGDNQWLLVIGDEKTIYIFPTNYLRKMKKRFKQVTTMTSIGLLMPIDDAERYCIMKIEVNDG